MLDPVNETLKAKLSDQLSQLAQHQRDFFWRIFENAGDVDKLSRNQLINAVDLCSRTIEKNIKDPKRLNSENVDEHLQTDARCSCGTAEATQQINTLLQKYGANHG